jgi:large subunit ribosomal protein L23
MNIYEVLVQPIITEKSTFLQEGGKYVFKVNPKAGKVQIKEAVEKNFNVKVLDVNITKIHGKRKRYGPRAKKLPDLKKAVVTLRLGDKIQIIEGI